MCTLNMAAYDTFDMDRIENENLTISCAMDGNEVDDKSVCKKCGCEDIQISFRNKNKYCKSCFLNMSTHKFKAMLGKSKLVRPNDSILIAHSGKANSTVLVHLLTADVNESASKKLRLQCKVLYIDDGMVKGRTQEERKSLQNAFAEEAEKCKLTTYIVSLSKSASDIISEEIHSINVPQITMSNEDAELEKSFNNLENDTAKDELLRQLRRKLLVSVARQLNCNKIFVADTSVDLAIKVLGDVSTGRGSQLPFNVGFTDIRHGDAMLLRPLRDFTQEDINGYLDCYKLCPVLSSKECDLFFPTSIRSITKSFVHQLDVDYYGTVSTIYRTSEKLATRIKELVHANTSPNNDRINTCIICELSIDSPCSQEEHLSVVQAKLFSKLVSTIGESSSDIIAANTLNLDRSLSNETIETIDTLKMQGCKCNSGSCNIFQRQNMVERQLCYSCRLIFLDSKQMYGSLPTFILNEIERKMQMAQLRNEIVDFLL